MYEEQLLGLVLAAQVETNYQAYVLVNDGD